MKLYNWSALRIMQLHLILINTFLYIYLSPIKERLVSSVPKLIPPDYKKLFSADMLLVTHYQVIVFLVGYSRRQFIGNTQMLPSLSRRKETKKRSTWESWDQWSKLKWVTPLKLSLRTWRPENIPFILMDSFTGKTERSYEGVTAI